MPVIGKTQPLQYRKTIIKYLFTINQKKNPDKIVIYGYYFSHM